ncbi:MAG: glycosyltransferase family 4 protein [Planctomycetes bacterium]|nr:glycosyltransferase family 4 protein [Planctomycetota bacterium]
MTILWHMPTLQIRCCGLSRRALQLARELATLGWQIEFAVHEDKTDCRADTIEGFPLLRLTVAQSQPLHWSLQSRTRRHNATSLVRSLPTGHDMFLSCQPEAVAAHKRLRTVPTVFVCGGSAILHEAAERDEQCRQPLTARVHFAIDRALRRRNERAAFRVAAAVIFDSDTTRDRVMSAYRLAGDRLFAAVGGVDAVAFTPASDAQRTDARRRFALNADAFTLAWTGRLAPEKNVELLLRAVAATTLPTIRLLLAGDGPQRAALESLAHTLGIADRVRFLGALDDVRPVLHAADVFAFPSRGESFGGALAEAMAAGLPCIALRSSHTIRTASEEIITHGITGLLADGCHEYGMADAIRTLAQDAPLRVRLATAARRHAEANFTWKRAGAALHAVLRPLLRSATRRPADITKQDLPCVLPST